MPDIQEAKCFEFSNPPTPTSSLGVGKNFFPASRNFASLDLLLYTPLSGREERRSERETRTTKKGKNRRKI